MSRALDKGVKEALQDGNHENVYQKVVSALMQRRDALLDVELLGSSYPLPEDVAVLVDENAVGVPKVRLIQSFIVARKKLMASSITGRGLSTGETLEATSVMLLMDAEHLTAANTRKRVIEDEITKRGQEAAEILQREKYFLDSLLTSRLHRHTKSPILWSHRRWLMGRFEALSLPVDVATDIRDVIFVSGERHPRNYYAWCHARLMVRAFGFDSGGCLAALHDTKKWCFTHHTDISGWMFLLFLLERDGSGAKDIFAETVRLAESFHWRNESVWYFLRNMALAEHTGGETLYEFYGAAERLGKGADEDGRKVLDETVRWAKRQSR